MIQVTLSGHRGSLNIRPRQDVPFRWHTLVARQHARRVLCSKLVGEKEALRILLRRPTSTRITLTEMD